MQNKFDDAAKKLQNNIMIQREVEFDSYRTVAHDPDNFFRAVIVYIFEHLIAMPEKKMVPFSLGYLKE